MTHPVNRAADGAATQVADEAPDNASGNASGEGSGRSSDAPAAVLQVNDLSTVFHTREGRVHAVNGITLSVDTGELVGVVGESGSGKSVSMMSLIKLLPSPPAEIVSGSVLFDGVDVLEMDEEQVRRLRGTGIGFVFQDPMTSLNPVFTVGFQLTEPLREHLGMSRKQARARAAELLELVGIPSPEQRLGDYPHQFSGGMRQRVMIAIALACNPRILIADEPTTALDVTIQAQIIDLVRKLREERGMGIVWITHDLGVIAGIADRVIVMYGGQIVEHALVQDLFERPAHPYTRALLQTLPGIVDAQVDDADIHDRDEWQREHRLKSIEGQPPDLRQAPASCSFAPRCEFAIDRCRNENPALRSVGHSHDVACWLDREQMNDNMPVGQQHSAAGQVTGHGS